MRDPLDPKNFGRSHISYDFFFRKKLYKNLINNIMGLQFPKNLKGAAPRNAVHDAAPLVWEWDLTL